MFNLLQNVHKLIQLTMLENLNKTIKLVKDITQYKNVFFHVVFYSSISGELESSLVVWDHNV